MFKQKPIKIFLLIFTVFLIGVANSKTVQAATPVSRHGQLTVKDSNLVDAHGKKFQLRGISTHGINWDTGKPYVNQTTFKYLRDKWGVNAIRLAMFTENYNGYCTGANQTNLKKLVEQGVTDATKNGMYVVIDWHISSDGNPNKHKAAAKKFFSTMSKKYQKQKNVIFEICNEPSNCNWDSIKSYAKTIISTIRKNDKKAIITVGTPTYSQLGSNGSSNEVADHPIKGQHNLMYALHFYAGEDSHNRYLPAKVTYARKKKLPIIVSEFGLSPASGNGSINTSQAQKWLKLLDKYSISYFCWSLSNKNETASLLKPSTAKLSNWKSSDLSKSGKFIKQYYLTRKKLLGKNS